MTTENESINFESLLGGDFKSIFGAGFFNQSSVQSSPKFEAEYQAEFVPVKEPVDGSYITELSATGESYLTSDIICSSITASTGHPLHMTGHIAIATSKDSIQGMISRIEELERQVEIFKTAAQTLAEMQREMKFTVREEIAEDPTAAYERAMKVVK